MAVPPEPTLRAAVRWLEALPGSSHSRVRALFVSAREYSDLTPTQYDIAYAWLKLAGLLDPPRVDTPVRERIFDAAILHSDALWLADADSLVQSPAELPSDVVDLAEALQLGEVSAFSRVQNIWGTVDLAERKRIGDAGEAVLIELLSDAASEHSIDHVAQRSDGFGYDIAVSRPGETLHVEVKATTRRSRARFFLSRNEHRTMIRDPSWHLVLVRLDAALNPVAIGSVPRRWIDENVPADRTASGRWESCRLDVPADVLVPGVPIELARSEGDSAALLTGTKGWATVGAPLMLRP